MGWEKVISEGGGNFFSFFFFFLKSAYLDISLIDKKRSIAGLACSELGERFFFVKLYISFEDGRGDRVLGTLWLIHSRNDQRTRETAHRSGGALVLEHTTMRTSHDLRRNVFVKKNDMESPFLHPIQYTEVGCVWLSSLRRGPVKRMLYWQDLWRTMDVVEMEVSGVTY